MRTSNSSLKLLFFLLSVFGMTAIGRADVTLPWVWSDRVVVQRGLPVHVWGKATAGEQVTIHFRDATATASANSLGKWELYLPPGEAGGPFTMEVQGANHNVLSDILVGDVWIASGQSNMEFST